MHKSLPTKNKKESLINKRENNNISKTRKMIPAIYLLQVNKNKNITQ
jgi:hypothetical protein